jgi:hypothetical protein
MKYLSFLALVVVNAVKIESDPLKASSEPAIPAENPIYPIADIGKKVQTKEEEAAYKEILDKFPGATYPINQGSKKPEKKVEEKAEKKDEKKEEKAETKDEKKDEKAEKKDEKKDEKAPEVKALIQLEMEDPLQPW